MTIISQTQYVLRQVMKERDELRPRVERHEDHANCMADQLAYEKAATDRWRSLYNDLAEPLENAARYCAILPPKTMGGGSRKRPHREYAIHRSMLAFDRPELDTFITHHRERLCWVQAMIHDSVHGINFQKLIHYRLNFDDGRALAYQHTEEAIRIQSKEFIIKEIAYQFSNLWHKEIHDAG